MGMPPSWFGLSKEVHDLSVSIAKLFHPVVDPGVAEHIPPKTHCKGSFGLLEIPGQFGRKPYAHMLHELGCQTCAVLHVRTVSALRVKVRLPDN